MNDCNRFNEAELPSIQDHYSKLNLESITKEDFRHAKNVWSVFKIRDLGDYHDFYVQSHTAQLSDVFENFRMVCLKEYELDPSYFVWTPGLALEAMLKMTKVKI